MRTVIIAVVAAVCGAVAGMAIMQQRTASEFEALRQARNAALEEATDLRRQTDEAMARSVALEREAAARTERLQHLEHEAAGLRQAVAQRAAPAQTPVMEEVRDEFAFPELPPPAPSDEGRDPDAEDRRRPWRGDFAPGDLRDMFREVIGAQAARSTDPAEQARLTAMAEYADYLADLREQMRTTEDEETRDALREQFMGAMGEARQIMEEQQRGMLVEFARAHGITTPQQQEAFVQGLQGLFDNPLFRAGAMSRGPMSMGMGWGPPRRDGR
ncbi:MAG TPA: hypothetical protein PKI11_12170 [Candidatus Hydrogenedentes bacterium]|nr:hypothetical protein [Candidatus Hydrogenedentota bacterium]HNT86355.1 hypothetical protein [Candidatus Hydrogenedentota bacterium]